MAKLTVAKWKKKVWVVFSKYIRLRDADDNGCCRCVTCGKPFHYKAIHAGHFIPKRNNAVMFEETNVSCQCVYCNMFMHGQGAKYYKFMLEKYGQEEIDRLMDLDKTIRKFSVSELEEMYHEYREKVKRIAKEKGIEL